jgi:hypothetical protein
VVSEGAGAGAEAGVAAFGDELLVALGAGKLTFNERPLARLDGVTVAPSGAKTRGSFCCLVLFSTPTAEALLAVEVLSCGSCPAILATELGRVPRSAVEHGTADGTDKIALFEFCATLPRRRNGTFFGEFSDAWRKEIDFGVERTVLAIRE